MPFQLQVEFTGLCMYLVHADPPDTRKPGDELQAEKVTVVIPECRQGFSNTRHADNHRGKHHVGYMRMDLAGIAGANVKVPPAGDGIPHYEVIHRFTKQRLDFGIPEESSMQVQTFLPEFEQFAPSLKPREELFDDQKAAPLAVLRTTLTGGSLTGKPRQGWKLPDLFSESGEYQGTFADVLTWSRAIEGADSLTLTLTPLAGGEAQQVTLYPLPGADGTPTISLRIANLCCENPLDWKELESGASIQSDEDFKWLYRLMTPPPGQTFGTMLAARGTREKLPIPHKVGGDRGGEGCVGGTTTVRPAGT
jgi:hypothetical protein